MLIAEKNTVCFLSVAVKDAPRATYYAEAQPELKEGGNTITAAHVTTEWKSHAAEAQWRHPYQEGGGEPPQRAMSELLLK